MALPTMNIWEFTAAAQSADPTANRQRVAISVRWWQDVKDGGPLTLEDEDRQLIDNGGVPLLVYSPEQGLEDGDGEDVGSAEPRHRL